jgi:hypothetical protein
MLTERDEKTLSELVKRAASDKAVQKQLLDDPSQFLRSNGITIPDGLEVCVVTDKDLVSLRLQSKPSAGNHAELTESSLENVVGGKGTSGKGTTDTGHIYLQFNFKLVAVKTVSW